MVCLLSSCQPALSYSMNAFLKQILQRPLFVNAGTLFSGTAVARVLSAFIIFIVARQLGLEQFGLYTAAWSLAKLTSAFFSLGLDSWLLRDAKGDATQLGRSTGSALALKSGLGAIWLAALVILAPFLSQDTFPASLLIFSAVAVWFEEVGTTAVAAFKAALRNTVTVWLVIFSQLIIFLATLGLAWLDYDTSAIYLAVRMVTTGVGTAVALYYMFRHFPVAFHLGDLPQTLRETLSFGISHGLSMIYGKADITIIAYFLGSIAAGIYSPASSLMATLFLVPTAVYEVMLPVFSRMHAENEKQIPKKGFNLILLSMGLGMLLGVGLALVAYPLVWVLYSPEFLASAPILVILSNVLLFKCISFALAAILAAVGWQGKRVWIQLGASIFNIGLNLLVVQNYGIIGIAYVYVLTEFLLTAGYLALLLLWQRDIFRLGVGQTANS